MQRGWIIVATAWLLAAGSVAAAAASVAGSRTCDLRTFGAHGDGTVETAAIQRAFDACAGGGTVAVPAGRWISGTLVGSSHLTLRLDAGATLAGSASVSDYRPGSDFGLGSNAGVDQAGEGLRAGLLVFRDVTDVRITGPGTIEGGGGGFVDQVPHITGDFDPAMTRNPAGEAAALRDLAFGPLETKASGRPGVLVLFFHAHDIRVDGVTLRDSPNWTLVFQDVTRLAVERLRIANSLLIPNDDGVDCNMCRDAHFTDVDITAGDDDFAFGNSVDVTVDRGRLVSRSAAIRVESTRGATFSHLTVDSNRGLAVFASRWSLQPTADVTFRDIAIRTRLIPGHWWGKAEPIYVAVQPCTAQPCREGVDGVTFSNIDATAEAGAVIAGAAGLRAAGVTLDHVNLRLVPPDTGMAAAIGGNLDRRWTAPTPRDGIVAHDLPAILADEVERLTLRDVVVTWTGDQPTYATESLRVDNFRGVVVAGLVERGTPPPRASALAFTAGSDLDVGHVALRPGRQPVVLDGVDGQRRIDLAP